MKVIGYGARRRQAQLHGSMEGLTHLHAHRFHRLAIVQAFAQAGHLLWLRPALASNTLHPTRLMQDYLVAVSLVPCILTNAKTSAAPGN